MKNVLLKMNKVLRNNSPAIMTGLGVVGVISTAVYASKATPLALQLIDEAEMEGVEWGGTRNEFTFIETVKIAWRPYAPAMIMGGLTIACILSANSINSKRNTALAGVYSLTENRLREYQRHVVETVGETQEEAIRDKIAKAEITNNPPSGEVTLTGMGEMLCYESLSGRYFRSDVENIKRVFNELNRRIVSDNFMGVYLNDFYEDLGLSTTRVGDMLGWVIDSGTIEPLFSSQLTDKNEPCLVVNFSVEPIADVGNY